MLGPALLGPGELERGEPGSRSSGAGTSAEGAWPCRSGMSLSAFSTGFSPLNPAGLNPARSSGLLCPAGAIAYPQKGWHRPSRAIRGQSRGRGSMLAAEGWPEAPAMFAARAGGRSAAWPPSGSAGVAVSVPPRCCLRPPGVRPAPGSSWESAERGSRVLGKWDRLIPGAGRGSAAPTPRSCCVPRGVPAPAVGWERPRARGTGTLTGTAERIFDIGGDL